MQTLRAFCCFFGLPSYVWQAQWSANAAQIKIPVLVQFSSSVQFNSRSIKHYFFHNEKSLEDKILLKVVSATFLLVFLSLQESTCEIRENIFTFSRKSKFRILDI